MRQERTSSPFSPSGATVGMVTGLCKSIEDAELQARFGRHFLLQRVELPPDGRKSWERFSTLSVDKDGIEEAVGAPKPDYLIYHVPETGKPPFPGWITVGRAKTNLIIIEHSSISKLHGLFVPEPGGTISLYDARSTNGTALNGAEAPRYGAAERLTVRSGDRVRFGSVHFLFLDAKALWTLLRDL